MFLKNAINYVSWNWLDAGMQPVTARSDDLTVRARKDGGSFFAPTPSNSVAEITPGWYEQQLTAAQCDAEKLDVEAIDNTTGDVIYRASHYPFHPPGVSAEALAATDGTSPWLSLFNVVQTADAGDSVQIVAFLNRLADHVLRRSQLHAEDSTSGDTLGINSLLGAIAYLTNGQEVIAAADGRKWLQFFSADPTEVLGQLRVECDSQGRITRILPPWGIPAVVANTQAANASCCSIDLANVPRL